MTRLLHLLGVDPEILRELNRAQLVVEHPVLLAVGLILLVPVTIYIYSRQHRNLGAVPPWLTIALSVTRVVVLTLLLLALAGPVLKLDFTREKKPILAVLLDHSDSMQLPAGPFDKESELAAVAKAAGYQQLDVATRKAVNHITRLQLAETVLEARSNDWQQALRERFDVREYTFAAELGPRLEGTRSEIASHPSGQASNALASTASTLLGDAITKVLDETGAGNLAGLIVLADGQNTGGTPLAAAAERAAALGVPVYTVPIGSTSVLRDVAVVDVTTAGQVALGDSARVTATLESHGLDGKVAKVQLLDGETVLDTRDVTLRGTEQQLVELNFETKHAGSRHLVVSVAPLPEEAPFLRQNNEASVVLRVSPEKIRVLYLEGLPRWDFRFLKNAMRRDNGVGGASGPAADIVLETEWRRRPAAQAARALPQTVEELAAYHTVILGDASPRLINPAFRKILAEAVRDRGVGLVVAAGPLFMPHVYDEAFQDLLPVRLHPRVPGVEAPAYRPFRVELTPEGLSHEVVRLDDDADRNRLIWGQLPPFYWCAAAERAAAGATVLAWNTSVAGKQGGVPLIAWQFAGKGRVVFVGLDATWRWRQNYADRYFYRFGGQALRFAARSDDANRHNTLEVRPAHAQPNDPLEIELQAVTADGTPRPERKLPVTVLALGQPVRTVELAADGARSGRYLGKFVAPKEGRYKIVFDPGAGGKPVDVTVPVLALSDEQRFPNVNRAALDTLATGTGGKLVELADLSTIAGKLTGETKTVAVRRQASLWDNWLMALVLVIVYSVDVGLRRLRGLA